MSLLLRSCRTHPVKASFVILAEGRPVPCFVVDVRCLLAIGSALRTGNLWVSEC